MARTKTLAPASVAGYRVAPVTLAPFVSLTYSATHARHQAFKNAARRAWGEARWPGIVFNASTAPDALPYVMDPASMRARSLAFVRPIQRTSGLVKLLNNRGLAASLDTHVVFPLRSTVLALLPVPDQMGTYNTVLDCSKNAHRTGIRGDASMAGAIRHTYVTRLKRGETPESVIGRDAWRCIICTREYAIQTALKTGKPVQVAGLKSIRVNADGTLVHTVEDSRQ